MNNYIIDLLNTNSRVIIPELGAFIVKQKNPTVVVFNEFLRYNDGLLIDYINVKEKVEKDVAKEKVVSFVKDINEKLSKGEEVFIEGLGKLLKESSGKISFVEDREVKGTEVVKEKKDAKKEEQKDIRLDTEESKVSAEKKVKTKSESTVKSGEPEKKIAEKVDVKISEPKEKQPANAEKEKPAVEKPKQPTVSVKKVEPQIKPVEKVVIEKPVKKSNKHILLWILLILIVNGAIVGWFLYNDKISEWIKKSKSKVESSVKPSENIPAENIQQDELVQEETTPVSEQDISEQLQSAEEETETMSELPATTYSDKKYYIVAGCFREESNADALVNELKKKGYNAEKFGKLGNLHAVSFASFLDKTSANEELKKIRNSNQPEAWIIYY